jgi:benzodiazapine receptor
MRLLLITLAAIATIGFNIYAVQTPLYGVDTAQISEENETLLTPAGFTFAIWGVIYVGLISFSLYALIMRQGKSEVLRNAATGFVVAAIANIAWLHFWHSREFGAALVLMLALLTSLIQVHDALKIGIHKHGIVRSIFFNAPISVYLGWICVASIINVAIVLNQTSWDRFGLSPEVWAAIMIGVAAGLAILMLLQKRDFAFAGAISWGLYGIYAMNAAVAPIGNVIQIAGVLILAATLVALYQSFTSRRQSNE